MKFRHIFFALLLIIVLCCQSRDEKQERAYRAARAKGDIIIGAAAPWNNIKASGMYWQGIEMAVDEVNTKGGVLGRSIRIIRKDDQGTVNQGRIVAQNFADNLDMVAVIGHYDSYISIPASVIYEYYGLLMLSPTSTSPELTNREGFKLVFRNVPTDEEVARQLARFAYKNGYKRMMIYFVGNAYGRGLAKAFEKQIEKLGGNIVDSLSYDSLSESKYFKNDLEAWKNNFSFDAIFLAGSVRKKAGQIISEARQLGISVPIMGGDGLLSPELWKIGGHWVEGTVVGAFFDPDNPVPEVQSFNKTFSDKYGCLPDDVAAQGYDAVKLLTYSIQKAGTTVPYKVADALRSTKGWIGVTGQHTFNEKGDVEGKSIVLKVVRNKRFVSIAKRRE